MKDKNIAELRQVAQTRMREGELRPLESDIKILEMKISHAKKNKEYEVLYTSRTERHVCMSCGPLVSGLFGLIMH